MNTREQRPRYRTTISRRITSRFLLGVEVNPSAPRNAVSPIGNYFLQTETDTRPGIVAGFSSDRIGTPYGMAYFVTTQKQLTGTTLRRFAPYVGLSYSEWGREVLIPFGASVALRDDLVLIPMCDGKHGHTTLSWSNGRGTTLSLVAAFNRRLGFAIARTF